MQDEKEKLLHFLKKLKDNEYYKNIIDFQKLNLSNVREIYLNLPIMNKQCVFDNIGIYFSGNFFDDCKSIDLDSLFFDTRQLSKNHDKIFYGRKNKWIIEFTTGSTGRPFPIVKSPSVKMIESAYLLKQRKIVDTRANLNNGFKFLHSLQPELYNIDIWKFKENDIKHIISEWLTNKPRWMLATPLIYSKYADYILEKELSIFDKNDLSFLEYTSQGILQEEREKIESVFKSRLINSYGTRECWNIAYECSEGYLHLNNDYIKVDIIDEDGKIINEYEKEGNVIITHLVNVDMPLIKYRFDDRAKKIKVDCKCGNKSDVICLCPDRDNAKLVNTPYYGTKIFRRVMRGIYFHDYIKDINNISIIQDGEYHISVYVVKQKENDLFFEKRFFERTKSIVPEIDMFTISFIYGEYHLNEFRNCKSVIFKNFINKKMEGKFDIDNVYHHRKV